MRIPGSLFCIRWAVFYQLVGVADQLIKNHLYPDVPRNPEIIRSYLIVWLMAPKQSDKKQYANLRSIPSGLEGFSLDFVSKFAQYPLWP